VKNVTISMDDELHRLARIEAAKAGKSMSRYIADKLESEIRAGSQSNARNSQLDALERFMAGPKLPISENGRMPTAEERNARR